MIFFFQLSISRAKDLQKIKLFPNTSWSSTTTWVGNLVQKSFLVLFQGTLLRKKKDAWPSKFFFGGGFFCFPAPMGGFCVQKCPFDAMQIGHFVLEREVKERTMVRPKVLFLQRLHAAEYIFETEGEWFERFIDSSDVELVEHAEPYWSRLWHSKTHCQRC